MRKFRRKTRIFLIVIMLLFLLPQMVWAEEAAVSDGDRLIFTVSDGSVALSAEVSSKGLLATEFLPDQPETATAWTVRLQSDGSWILESDQGRLSMDPETGLLTLNAPADCWILTDPGDGTVCLTNLQDNRVLTWYPAHETFGLADSESEFSWLKPVRLPEPMPPEPEEDPDEPEPGGWKFYFGQLHSHTADSDGAGSVAAAFAQADGVPGVDFYAVTDHSDSFDNDTQGSLTSDGSLISEVWAKGKAAAEAATTQDFVAIYGFEMSWNQGQGHISTFNTPGFASRDQDTYQMYKDGMEHYFDALLSVPGSVSQFNHPGSTYGDFKDFDSYAPELDQVISLIEVGSGEGRELSSYLDMYVQALDKGWHLAPTASQNDHTGSFGNATSPRTVVLAKELTEQSLYEAMKARRVYATEDTDLQICYSLDGAVMGSILRRGQLGDTVELLLQMYDPTDQDLGTVEVIGPGGEVISSGVASATMSATLPADAAYYFLRIVQGDGDVSITAPVWIRQRDNVGISSFETGSELTRAGEAQTLLLTVYNREPETMQITSVTVTDKGGKELGAAEASALAGYGTVTHSFPCTFDTDGMQELTALVLAAFPEGTKELTQTIQVSVMPAALTSDVLVDGTHGQKDTFAEFTALAAAQNISLRTETESVSTKQLEACRLLVIPAPETGFEPEFLELVKNYVNNGGQLLLLGKAGGSIELNRLLEHLGSAMALNGDTAKDEIHNGGSPEQIYTALIASSQWTEDVMQGQTYAHINGCTVTGGEWLAKSNAGDVLLAQEEGILLAGSNFLEDAHLKTETNAWALPYANRTIAETILGITRTPAPVAPISEIRVAETGRIYLVEGLVTAGTHNVNTDFPDSIYIQDETGAIEVRGYAEHGLELGTPVLVYGVLKTENGRPVLNLLSLAQTRPEPPLTPESLDTIPDYAQKGDQLVKIQGTVIKVETQGGVVRSFVLKDSTGAETVVWVEEYILSGSLGRNHLSHIVRQDYKVSAVGFCHLQDGKTVLRLRDCDEVVLLWAPAYPDSPATGDATNPVHLVLLMAICCLLAAVITKQKDRS